MKLEISVVETLPRFAWLVNVEAGRATAFVGPWVEHGDGWFVEGAWNGEFGEARPDQATCMVGTACVTRRDEVIVVCASTVLDTVYSIRHEGKVLVSNSLAFLMEQVGFVPDPSDDRYLFEIIEPARQGIRRRPYRLPGGFSAHVFVNVVLTADGRVRHEFKPVAEPPVDFASLRDLFRDAMKGVFANAADAARRHPLRPVAAISSGYDSAAVAGLAGPLGCREAVTSIDPEVPDDSGTPVGEAVGMKVTEYPRWPPDDLDTEVVAEFMAVPAGVDLPRAVMEKQLEGSVLLVGNQGDRVFGVGRGFLSRYRNPHAYAAAVTSMNEFRKRIGMVPFVVPSIAGLYPDELYAITHSDEMRPWWVPGRYNRPIARRLAVEGGIPPGAFAHTKAATSHVWPYRDGLPPAADDALKAWMRDHGAAPRPLGRLGRLVSKWQARYRRFLKDQLSARSPAVRDLLAPIAVLPWWHRSHTTFGSSYLFGFHWGTSIIQSRYRVSLPDEPAR